MFQISINTLFEENQSKFRAGEVVSEQSCSDENHEPAYGRCKRSKNSFFG